MTVHPYLAPGGLETFQTFPLDDVCRKNVFLEITLVWCGELMVRAVVNAWAAGRES